MKKHLAYTAAVIVALSAVGTPVLSVSAQTQTITVVQDGTQQEIKTAEGFIQLYWSYKEETKDNQGKVIETTYKTYTEVNETNYEQILAGETVFTTLSQDLQDEINKELENQKIPSTEETPQVLGKTYGDLVVEAKEIQAKIIKENEDKAEDEENNKENVSSIESQASTGSTEKDTNNDSTNEKKPSNAINQDEQSGPLKVESKEESDTKAPISTEEKTEVENKSVSMAMTLSLPVVETDTASKTVAVATPQKTSSLLKAVNTPAPTVETKVEAPVETVTSANETLNNVTIPSQATSVQSTAVSNRALSSVSASVQTFVQTYLMDDNSNLYTSANAYNYQQILSGLTTFNKMSTEEVSQLNSYLRTNGSQMYITLVSQAQRIQNGGALNTTVNTSASSGFGLYGALFTISSVGIIAFLKKVMAHKA